MTRLVESGLERGDVPPHRPLPSGGDRVAGSNGYEDAERDVWFSGYCGAISTVLSNYV